MYSTIYNLWNVTLETARRLDPTKEYIPHKLAQAHLAAGDGNQALGVYESIPVHKRTPYILNGMGKCLLKKDRPADALALFYKAHKKELTKSYHLRDVGLALSALGDRDKAIAFLTKYNSALMAEYGKGSAVIIAKIEELSKLPQKQTIDLSDFDAPVPKICQGTITTYVSARGFGFIEDQSDSERVFFHIKRVKRGFEPSVGSRVKFVREVGEKGPLASKVWPASS